MSIAQVSILLESMLRFDNQRNAEYEVFAEVLNIPSQIKKSYLIFNGQIRSVKKFSGDGPFMSHSIDINEASDSIYAFVSEIENSGWDSAALLLESSKIFNNGAITIYPDKDGILPHRKLGTAVLRSDQSSDLYLQDWPEKDIDFSYRNTNEAHNAISTSDVGIQIMRVMFTIGMIVLFLWIGSLLLLDRPPPCPNPRPTPTADGRVPRIAACRD